MKEINISIKDKIAVQTNREIYICGNSDFIVNFDFDADWEAYDIKTARFVYNNTFTDVVFSGNQCAMPVISGAYNIQCGVFAGDLCTTTSAWISAKRSILCADGSPTAPSEDVYAQIMELLNSMEKPTAAEVSAVFALGKKSANNVQRALDLLRVYRGKGILFSPEAPVPTKSGEVTYVDGIVSFPNSVAVDGDIVIGRNGYIAEVDTSIQTDGIAAVATGYCIFDPDEVAHTTLTRDGKAGTVTVHFHGLRAGERYALHLYTAYRRKGRCQKEWRHTPNYDSSRTDVHLKGYGNLSGVYFAHVNGNTPYPVAPEWMPNGGFLQTEWAIQTIPTPVEKIEINLKQWLLPMLKPLDPAADDPWAECGMIGLGRAAGASLLMQWRLVRLEDGVIGDCLDTLKVGVLSVAGKGEKVITRRSGQIDRLYTAIV